jgi:hypothetical protein
MTERVVSTKVLGSSNPIAKKFRSVKSAISGIGCGIFLLVIGIVLVYNSVYGVKEYSKIVETLPLKNAAEVTSNEELVKLTATAKNSVPVSVEYDKCTDKYCSPFSLVKQSVGNLFYYSTQKQRFEIVKIVRQETRTEEFAGQETEKTVEITEYKEQWVNKDSSKAFGQFELGSVKVIGNDLAKLMLSKSTQTIPLVKIDNLTALENYGQVPSASVGSTQLIVESIPVLDEKPVIVVGKVENGEVKSGDPFIITTLSEAKLIEELKSEESVQKAALLVFSWLALFIGLGMLIAPILELVNWIPLFGSAAKFAAGVISFILATLIVLGSYVLMRFWYVFIIIFVGVIVLAIVLVSKNSKKKTETTEAPVEKK